MMIPPASAPSSATSARRRSHAIRTVMLLVLGLLLVSREGAAQARVGRDSSTRLTRYGRDLLYGTVLGFGYAGIDQWRNDPVEWGSGSSGYGKRLASNVGEFAIQETVTDLLAAAMNRPLDYQPCHCHDMGERIGWALEGAITDPTPGGHHLIAVPRIVGAYAGSFAQASWRPNTPAGRTRIALVNGTTSLLIGAGINLFHEMRAH
jgi:hypothetical protein